MDFLGMWHQFWKAYFKGFKMQERSREVSFETIQEKQLWRQAIFLMIFTIDFMQFQLA